MPYRDISAKWSIKGTTEKSTYIGLNSSFLSTWMCKNPEHRCQKFLPDKTVNPYTLPRHSKKCQSPVAVNVLKKTAVSLASFVFISGVANSIIRGGAHIYPFVFTDYACIVLRHCSLRPYSEPLCNLKLIMTTNILV